MEREQVFGFLLRVHCFCYYLNSPSHKLFDKLYFRVRINCTKPNNNFGCLLISMFLNGMSTQVMQRLVEIIIFIFIFFIRPSYPPSPASFSIFAIWGTAFLVKWVSPGQIIIFIGLYFMYSQIARLFLCVFDVYPLKKIIILVYNKLITVLEFNKDPWGQY